MDMFKPAPAAHPAHKVEIFKKLADGSHFSIENRDDSNQILIDKANTPKKRLQSIKKYLPATYRQSFNFIAPKLKGNGVTDDSYHCALRDAKTISRFQAIC